MADSLEPRDSGGAEPERPHSTELEPRAPQTLELPGVSAEPYMGRFRFALGVLGGLGLAALIVAGVIIAGGRPATPPDWSSWKPSGDSANRIQQIANHIGPTYHLPGGNQLVAVNAAPLAAQGAPVITVRTKNAINQVDSRNGVIFQLCGLGPKCSIDKGSPSNERGLLLRREGLELAAYTFRYVDSVNLVIVTLPPRPSKDPNLAMYFRRDDVKPILARPLEATLPSPPPSVARLRERALAGDLVRKTQPEVYAAKVDATGTQLVLDQSPPGEQPSGSGAKTAAKPKKG